MDQNTYLILALKGFFGVILPFTSEIKIPYSKIEQVLTTQVQIDKTKTIKFVGISTTNRNIGIFYVVGKGKEFGQKLADEYRSNHYHRPSDQIDSTWTFHGGIEDLKLLFLVGKRLAFETKMPQWKDGSEFRKLRK